MSDPTVFSLPRRRVAIAAYSSTGLTSGLALRDVGIINGGEVTFDRENTEYNATDLSAGSCLKYVADSDNDAPSGTLTIELMSNVAANLGLMLSSAVTTVASGAATEEVSSASLVDNDLVKTDYIPDPDTVVITDSEVSPATLVLDTDYEWVAKKSGLIRILDAASYTLPLKINYTKIAAKQVDPMSSLNDYWTIVTAGGNERNSCGGESEVFYRCRISDAQTKRLHEAADQRTAVPTTVSIRIDRDPNRTYKFGVWDVTES